jgi:hypothetical protein
VTKDEELIEQYRKETGRNPRNLPDDHPDRWQWDYMGRKEEREALEESVRKENDDPQWEQKEMFDEIQ